MKAVGYKRALPIDDPESLLDVNLPEPVPEAHDLLVDVKAVSVTAPDRPTRQDCTRPDAEALMIPLRLVIDTNVPSSAAIKPAGLQRTVPLTISAGLMSAKPRR